MAHFSVKQRSPFKKSFCASRRHKRQTASRCLANFFSPFGKTMAGGQYHWPKLCLPRLKSGLPTSNAAALGRTAAVVRNRRDVANHHNVQACGGQSAHGGFAAGAGTLHAHFDRLETVLIARVAGGA